MATACGQLLFYLFGALHVNFEHQVQPLALRLLEPLARRAVLVLSENAGMFQKLARREPCDRIPLRKQNHTIFRRFPWRGAAAWCTDTENIVPGTSSIFCTSVDFPEPEGPETMNTRGCCACASVIRRSAPVPAVSRYRISLPAPGP